MIKESEIRLKLVELVQGNLELAAFEDWLVDNSWNMHLDSSRSAQNLVATIELALAEYSNGHLSRDELRSKLMLAAGEAEVDVQVSDNYAVTSVRPVVTGTSSRSRQVRAPAIA